MRLQGVADKSQVTGDEMGAYVDLLRREDQGAAFLKIMRGFELARAKHFLQEDQAPAIADEIAGFIRSSRSAADWSVS